MYVILKDIVSRRSFEFYKDIGIFYVFISFFYNSIFRNYKEEITNSNFYEITFIILPIIVTVLFIIFLHGFILASTIFYNKLFKYASFIFVYTYSAIWIFGLVFEIDYSKGDIPPIIASLLLGVIMILMGIGISKIYKKVGTVAKVLFIFLILIGCGFIFNFLNLIFSKNVFIELFKDISKWFFILNKLPVEIAIIMFYSKLNNTYNID